MTPAFTQHVPTTIADPARRLLYLRLWLPGLVLSLAVAALCYGMAARTVRDDARQRFDGLARSAQVQLAARLATFSDLARGASALFQASPAPVSRLQFHRYIAALEIDRHFPEIEQVWFAGAAADDADARARLVETVRGERSAAPAGYPDGNLVPPAGGADQEVPMFMEPTPPRRPGGSSGVGVDLAGDAAMAAALARSRDSGKVATSVLAPPASLSRLGGAGVQRDGAG